ncbi:MAG TPA: hypothetical protein VGF97_14845 [Rhizomicrobium sp.]|jgi:hypothetical protein
MSATLERHPEPASSPWTGRPIAPVEIGAILFVGTVGILIAGLQPVLLGALADEGRLTTSQLGIAATAELLAIGLAAGLAGAFVNPRGLRYWGASAALMLAVIDALTGGETGFAVVANRAIAGLAEGIMIWIAVGMIARSTIPDRWSAIYLALQTLAQLGYSAILPVTIMVRHGAGGGFGALSATALVCCGVSFLLPSRFGELPRTPAEGLAGGRLPLRAIGVLLSVFLFMAFLIGVWAYLGPIAAAVGLPAGVADEGVSLSLAAQVAGALLAVVLAGRVSYFHAFVGCTLANLGVLAVLGTISHASAFLAATGIFGFLWLFVLPFQVPLAIEADPSRRAAMLLPGAQLLGAAAGPLLCSFAVTGTNMRGVFFVSAALLVSSFAVMILVHWSRRSPERGTS